MRTIILILIAVTLLNSYQHNYQKQKLKPLFPKLFQKLAHRELLRWEKLWDWHRHKLAEAQKEKPFRLL